MVHPTLFISQSPGRGRGIFTKEKIPAQTVIEISPVIVMTLEERKMLDQTLLHDYIFEWGSEKNHCCMAMGYVPVYNHSSASNCEYEMDYQLEVIRIKTVRQIQAGEELFINYNGDWDDNRPLWFDPK